MTELVRQKSDITRTDISKKMHLNCLLKGRSLAWLINDLPGRKQLPYIIRQFTDLCRGPHLPNTEPIKAIKVLSVAGAYWRGNEKNKMLTRIYAISFPKAKLLDEYLILLEEAKKRDHRKIGKEMELFAFSPEVGMGLPLVVTKEQCFVTTLSLSSGKFKRAWISAGMTRILRC